MSLGFRRRLLLTSLVFITVVDFGVGLYLDGQLQGSLEDRIRQELLQDAHVMQAVLAEPAVAPGDPRDRLDAVADRYGEAMGARVSVIGQQGELLADSDLPAEALVGAGDHSDRAEVVAARAQGLGMTQAGAVAALEGAARHWPGEALETAVCGWIDAARNDP